MKLKNDQYEIFINGKKIKTINGHDSFYQYLEDYSDEMSKAGYKIIKEVSGFMALFVIFSGEHNIRHIN